MEKSSLKKLSEQKPHSPLSKLLLCNLRRYKPETFIWISTQLQLWLGCSDLVPAPLSWDPVVLSVFLGFLNFYIQYYVDRHNVRSYKWAFQQVVSAWMKTTYVNSRFLTVSMSKLRNPNSSYSGGCSAAAAVWCLEPRWRNVGWFQVSMLCVWLWGNCVIIPLIFGCQSSMLLTRTAHTTNQI